MAWSPPELITVNGFTFCKDHGWELCPKCCYDFTLMNNMNGLDDELTEDDLDDGIDTEDRPQFNIYSLGAIKSNKRCNDGDGFYYMCREHQEIDCEICFDWFGMFLTSIGEISKVVRWQATAEARRSNQRGAGARGQTTSANAEPTILRTGFARVEPVSQESEEATKPKKKKNKKKKKKKQVPVENSSPTVEHTGVAIVEEAAQAIEKLEISGPRIGGSGTASRGAWLDQVD